MARRFSTLERMIKLPNDALQNYKDYKAGDRKITRTGVATKGKKELVLIPFGLRWAGGDAKKTIVQCSQRAFDDRTNAGLTDALLGIDANVPADFDPGIGFEPAKAVVFKATGGYNPKEPSGITGIPYAKRKGESITMPFGQLTTGDDNAFYAARCKAIYEAVETKDSKYSTSFIPEHIKV